MKNNPEPRKTDQQPEMMLRPPQQPDSASPAAQSKNLPSVGVNTDQAPDSLPTDTCLMVRDLLPLYAEQLTSKPSERFVEEHLENCPACRAQLETLRQGEAALDSPADSFSSPPEIPIEQALRKVNKTFHRHRISLIVLSLLILLLVIGGGFLLSRSLLLPPSSVEVSVLESNENDLTLELKSWSGKPFASSVDSLGEGKYAIREYGFQFGQEPVHSNLFTMQKPVELVTFNGEVIYEDGIAISERCRQNYPYANGYAGDTSQMALARPAWPFIISASTEDPNSCIWSYILHSEKDDESLVLGEDEQYNLRCNAMLALALTPNLSEIRYCSANGSPVLSITREQMLHTLQEHGLDDQIDSYASMQKIMQALLPAAG